MIRRLLLVGLVVIHAIAALARAADDPPAVRVEQTPGGVRYGLLGPTDGGPRPTLFIFSTDVETSLGVPAYSRVGELLLPDGVLCVSLDVPCHGMDRRPDEAEGLAGWRQRIEAGENVPAVLAQQASTVLDHLVAQGLADPERVAACGTSRGGFIALHFTAAEPRVRAVVAFAPVTELPALSEFAGLESHESTRSLDLGRQAEKLADRGLWLCIGNRDERVGTDLAIAFTRGIVAAAAQRETTADVELRVTATLGHRIHDAAHDEAAAWLRTRLVAPRP